MPSIGLFWRSVRHYEPAQLWNYVFRRVVKPSVDSRPAPKRRSLSGRYVEGIKRPLPMSGNNTFRLLNRERAIETPSDWNSSHCDKLWLYTLHYHEWLAADHSHAQIQAHFIRRWIDENPPAEGVGWDPYPISIRVLHWIKWLTRGELPIQGMLDSLAIQMRILAQSLESHLGANHLLSNAIALSAAGQFFEGEEADCWRSIGLDIVRREIPKQFGEDGGHFELSASYHALLLEGILDLENLFVAYEQDDSRRPWTDLLPRARNWLAVMTRPDGTYPHFNDCAQGVAPTAADIEAYAMALGLEPSLKRLDAITDLPDSGYARLHTERLDIFIDAGKLAPRSQPGHSHCDMLSFEVCAGGIPIIVNGGTSTYERSERRALERSTASHNTVQVSGFEQSELWNAFRAGRTARIVERVVEPNRLTAAHDGFRPVNLTHRRAFCLEHDQIIIVDHISGTHSSNRSTARMHFVPGVTPKTRGESVWVFEAGPLEITLRSAEEVRIVDYEYAPEFNLRLPAKLIEVEFSDYLETVIRAP